jgi:hypothetical protein
MNLRNRVFAPYDDRKLYASIERAQYGHFILAPCFQPDPKSHAFGGDPKKEAVFSPSDKKVLKIDSNCYILEAGWIFSNLAPSLYYALYS